MTLSIDGFGASFNHYLKGVIPMMGRTSNARKIPSGSIKWQGKKLVMTFHYAYNSAIGDAVDGGAIPAADQQYHVQGEVYRKNTVGAAKVTDGVRLNASTTSHSATTYTKSELRGMTTGMAERENFFFHQDGSARVAYVKTAISGATASLEVDDSRGIWKKGNYEIRDSSTLAVKASFSVKSRTRSPSSNKSIVTAASSFTGAEGIAVDDLVIWGQGVTSSYGKGITGLKSLIGTGAIQGISASDHPEWSSAIFNGGGASQSISPRLLRQVLATLKNDSPNDMAPSGILLMTDIWTGLEVEEMFQHAIRITPDSKSVGISGGLTFRTSLAPGGKVTVVTDAVCPYGYMWAINRKAISRPIQSKLHWRMSDKGGIFERSDDNLSYRATCLEVHDLCIKERNSCAVITNLVQDIQSAY